MPYAVPSSHMLLSMQSQTLEWWKRIAELIDNSLDAGANRVAISFRDRAFTVTDDGCGIHDPQVLVTLGAHSQNSKRGLGQYGIGAKDAWLCTGPVLTIETVHKGVLRNLSVDVRQMAKDNWFIPETVEAPTSRPSGTVICISLKTGQVAPLWKNIAERLGWVFAPALRSGRQIIHTDSGTPLVAAELPQLTDVVRDSFTVAGRPVEMTVGILPPDGKIAFGPFWIQYRHRMINGSSVGTRGRCTGRLGGTIVLGDGWHLSKNKDAFFDDIDSLDDAIFSRIEGLLQDCESTTEQIQTDILKLELESRLNAALWSQKRKEKRTPSRERQGTVLAAFSGRTRQHATKSSDDLGSVTGDPPPKRRGFSLGWVTEEEAKLGKFDVMAKTVYLNLSHPAIASWKRDDNKDALFAAASVILANHDATVDQTGQRVMSFGVGEFLGPFSNLIASLVTSEGGDDAAN